MRFEEYRNAQYSAAAAAAAAVVCFQMRSDTNLIDEERNEKFKTFVVDNKEVALLNHFIELFQGFLQ